MNTENMKFIPMIFGMTAFAYDRVRNQWVVWDEDAVEPGQAPPMYRSMYRFQYREGVQPEGIFVRNGNVVRVQYPGE